MSSNANNFFRPWMLLAALACTAIGLYWNWSAGFGFWEMASTFFRALVGFACIRFGYKFFADLKNLKGKNSPFEYIASFIGMLLLGLAGASLVYEAIFHPIALFHFSCTR